VPEVAFTLPASSRGTGDGHSNAWNSNYVTDHQAVWKRRGGHGYSEFGDIAPTLESEGGTHTGGAMGTPLIAFHSKAYGQDATEGLSPPVRAAENDNGDTPPAISNTAGVRRLTPLECERLQGWPDEHTRWTADGKEIPDSHRYRMIGNGVASPCAEWLGHRLVAVDRLMSEGVA